MTIIVLTFNRRRLLVQGLATLFAQDLDCNQLEVLVCDDGSTDGTRHSVQALQLEHPNLRYLRQPHKGIPAARNLGIRHAKGDFIAIVADDYLLPPEYASSVVAFFHEHPEADIVRSKLIASRQDLGSRISHLYFDASIQRRLHLTSPTPEVGVVKKLCMLLKKVPPPEERVTTDHHLEAAGAAGFRRDVFERVGLFDETLLRAEDSDLTQRLRKLNIPVHYNPALTVAHQYHPLMLDTLHKCFSTGLYRYRYHRKHPLQVAGHPTTQGMINRMVRHKINGVVHAIFWVRQAAGGPQMVFYLPFMLLFEAVNKLGFVCGWVSSRRS